MPPEIIVLNFKHTGTLGFLKILIHIKNNDVVILNGALGARDLYRDMLAAVYLRFLRPSTLVIISDATWHSRAIRSESKAGRLLSLVDYFFKTLVRLSAGENTHFCFLSKDEAKEFPNLVRISEKNAHFTLFCTQFPDDFDPEQFDAQRYLKAAPAIFAGGNSLRDYQTLVEALRSVEIGCTIATSHSLENVPPHIRVGFLDTKRYFTAMAESTIVIVPLIAGLKRSVGQQTYLNAMALGKLVIVADVVGVRDVVRDGETGLIVPPGDPTSMRDAVSWALDPRNSKQVNLIRENAREFALSRGFGHYFLDLYRLAQTIASRKRDGVGP